MDAQIKSSSGKAAAVVIEIRTLKTSERRAAALKGLGISWGLALATLPLPPLHWVSVPFFFFFGFYLFWKKWGQQEYSRPFVFSCPECGKPIEAGGEPLRSSWQIICPHCRFTLQASAAAS